MRIAGIAATALLLAAPSACDDGSEPGTAAPGDNPLLAAVAATEAQGSARATMTFRTESASGGKLATTRTTSGVVDWDAGAGSVKTVMRFEPPPEDVAQPPPSWSVWDGDFMYRKGERVTEHVDGRPEWVRLSFLELGPLAATPLSDDPTRAIEYLRGATPDYEELGSAVVRGVETVRYEAELDFGKMKRLAPDPDVVEAGIEYFELLGFEDTVPAEVWLDGEGRLVRFRISGGEGDTFETFVVELYDFGVDGRIEIPRDAKAVSIFDLL